MSLINEALRKARQAASERESKQPEGPFQPSRTHRSRQSRRGSGLPAMVVIAVAAGVVGAGATWWLLSDREPAPTEKTIFEYPSIEAATPLAAAAGSHTPVVDRAAAEQLEASPRQEPARVEVEQTVSESAPPAADAEEAATDADENRVFVMEAEIGGVSLSLGYIVARSSNPFAEINGTEVRIGSEIEGFVVESIEADRVILRDGKGPLVLRVP